MSNHRSPSVWSLLVVLGLCGCAPVNDFEIVQGGSISESDGFWFQDGGLFLTSGSPGVMFGMARKPGGEREFAYIAILQHRATATSKLDRSSDVNFTGGEKRSVTMNDGIGIGGQRVDLKLVVEIDSRTKMVKREHLTFGGKEVDLGKGRLFLVDLRAETPKWEQVQAKLPTKLPDPTETKGVRELVKRVFDELPKESAEVREFLKR